jgi:sporulation protein YlmC with PRC-barrel domain
MKKHLWLSAAAVAMAMGITQVGFANESFAETVVSGQVSEAGALVGKNVHDAAGDVVGEIDAVLVDRDGKVSSVVMDVSGWLESEKLVGIKWSELKQDVDGNLTVTNLTKEQAEGMEGYAYADPQRRGQVLTEEGEIYAPMTGTETAASTDAANTTGTTTGTTDSAMAPAGPSEIRNSDGTVNTSNVLGATLEGGSGDNIGEIDEVIINTDGKVQGVVVDVGGILGVGARSVLLDWNDIEMTQRDGKEVLTINATEETLKAMPEYKAPAAN